MKRLILLLIAPIMLFVLNTKKKTETTKGTLTLSMTDAPVDTDGIQGVYITVTGVQYNLGGNWITAEEFEGPKTFNLLDLTRGVTEMMGSFELQAGSYNQIRFMLDIPEHNQGNISNPGCYIEFDDQTTKPLFVPSGGQSGYKAVGEFDVPINGEVSVTADFDVRKAVVATGSGKYILKPTIRLVVDNEAGAIRGDITNIPANTKVVVYAYEAGTYTPAELTPADEETPKFANAVSSDVIDMLNQYRISFLAAGKYDLVVSTVNAQDEVAVAGIVTDVTVESKKTTSVNLDMENL